MKEHLIHIEEIKKPGAKLQFQVKLPGGMCKITGIQVTLVPKLETQPPTPPPHEGEEVPPGEQHFREPERGWLRLRIPERRDVFYAENTQFPSHELIEFNDILKQGLSGKSEKWFSGKRQKYYSVDVPIKDTLIEGFYEDRSTEANVDYQLKIYFRLNDYTK